MAAYIGLSPPLVLLHGFTQTGASWAPVTRALGGRWPLLTPDAPGHGSSAGVDADLWETAERLAGLVDGPAYWAGYSMGGRTALHLALAHPQRVAGLVLISTSAGIVDPCERAARRAADDKLAARIEEEGVERFLTWWLAQPLFAGLPAERAGREARLANTPRGLATSLRRAGPGAQEPLWGRLGELRRRQVPVLVMAGQRDTRYVGYAEQMVAAIGPRAALQVVAGAGHACHLERPEAVAEALAKFCARARDQP